MITDFCQKNQFRPKKASLYYKPFLLALTSTIAGRGHFELLNFPPKITKPKWIGLKLGVKVHCGTQCISVRNRPIVNLNTLGGPGVGPACLNEPRRSVLGKNWWFLILHFVKNNKSGINRGWNESFWSTQEMYSPCRIFYFFPKFPQIREIIKSLYLATM